VPLLVPVLADCDDAAPVEPVALLDVDDALLLVDVWPVLAVGSRMMLGVPPSIDPVVPALAPV
jgi:hypothetical protein